MHRRSSVSRMRENRTYGLKGGWGNGPATAPRPSLPMAVIRLITAAGSRRRQPRPGRPYAPGAHYAGSA